MEIFTWAKANLPGPKQILPGPGPGWPGCGYATEVEGVRYIEMHRGPHTYWAPPPSRGGDLELESGVDVSL